MEKFGMSFGGGSSKKDLVDTIESQKKQLVQYQTRFKDVVRAYKSLLKEKEALEASLKVLTTSQELDLSMQSDGGSLRRAGFDPADLHDDHCSLHSQDSLDTAASADTAASVNSEGTRGEQTEEERAGTPGEAGLCGAEANSSESGVSSASSAGPEQHQAAAAPPEADRRVSQLKTQLSTLTSSLATVSQEKSRMEASFQADKRKMKQELEELQVKLEESRKQQKAELQALQEQLAESKARVITQQHEREQEQGDYGLMLRELQKLLQEERDLRQDAEIRLEDARAALVENTQAAERRLQCETRLSKVTEEREDMRMKLRAAEAEKNKGDPRVEELQQELHHVKQHYQLQLQQESRKACQAEERARGQAQAEEGRVASLEERVSELSGLLGNAEKCRQRDQQAAHRLRERILQLDTENKTLAIAASARVASDLSMDDSNLDVNTLKDKLEKVKRLLLLASQRNPEQPLEIERLEAERDGEKTSTLYYQQELRQLKDEFERYKARAQVVLKNKNAKDGSQAKELEEARDQLAELKEKYINLRIHSDEAEAKHKRELEERQQRATVLQQGHKQEVERGEAVHRDDLLKLEGELHKQRQRTMALLAEKDQELEKLRALALTYSLSSSRGDADRTCDFRADRSEDRVAEESGQEECDFISQALRLAGPNEPTLLLYAEQLARKEVEVVSLRRHKHRLEDDVHRLQGKLIANGERHDEEETELRSQLDKVVRDQRREGANLEYLKNVIFKFLTLQDSSGRQQTLGAILTILHFSPQEKQAVSRLQGTTWWQPGKR
ncbi:GRIP and coiled-coil domain-containing protein 1 [Genypterus blacodes]|uniref:GRIP and coiled-coil domain-containing protein 1 n=1 Tax=Genypterus blacodes TaxID=154954 RepID=UPI003F771C22